MMRRARLRTYAPMKKVSEKVRQGEREFSAVYREVDQRSEGRCEFWLPLEYAALTSGESLAADPIVRLRCRKRATDHHHLVKPRRSAGHHTSSLIVHLCREHHDRCEWPFARGRLLITAAEGRGEFTFAIRYASDKFTARGQSERVGHARAVRGTRHGERTRGGLRGEARR